MALVRNLVLALEAASFYLLFLEQFLVELLVADKVVLLEG